MAVMYHRKFLAATMQYLGSVGILKWLLPNSRVCGQSFAPRVQYNSLFFVGNLH